MTNSPPRVTNSPPCPTPRGTLSARRTGHYDLLPQLGAIISLGEPNSSELQVLVGCEAAERSKEGTDVEDSEDKIRQNCMTKWLEVYAELPHEGIGLCVANAFVEAFEERDAWAVSKPWRDNAQLHNVESQLGAVFLKVAPRSGTPARQRPSTATRPTLAFLATR